jgi:acetoin utilization deacetylase AcuC-like enzyme
MCAWLASVAAAPRGPVSPAASRGPVFYYNDVYRVDLPDNHRFPMGKYEAVRVSLERELQEQAVFRVSPLASAAELTTTHTAEYVRRVLGDELTPSELRRIGFPGGRQSIDRALSSVGGTVAAARALFEAEGQMVTAHIAGGTHHAFADRGEGYCVFSDIAVAANCILREQPSRVRRVLIVDLDVHQGNGNAALFANRPDVFTFSMHCAGNYFSAVEQSDLDVEVPIGATDEQYMAQLDGVLDSVFHQSEPSLVFFQAGVDALARDRFGKLSLSRAGLRRRNEAVFERCAKWDVPLVATMGGGYPRNLESASGDAFQVVQAHMDVYRGVVLTHQRWPRRAGDALRRTASVPDLGQTASLRHDD